MAKTRTEKFDRGLATRRAVLGDGYDDRALAQVDDFSLPVQQLVTSTAGMKFGIDQGWTGGRDRSST
jgi:hypothetical protein